MNEQTPITIAAFLANKESQWRGSLLQTQEDPDGYELVHNVFTQPGMSGSPVFDAKGNLIAIHGRSLPLYDTGNKGFAIPIYYYTNWQNTTALIPNPFQTPTPYNPNAWSEIVLQMAIERSSYDLLGAIEMAETIPNGTSVSESARSYVKFWREAARL